jgi:hypothetical protein
MIIQVTKAQFENAYDSGSGGRLVYSMTAGNVDSVILHDEEVNVYKITTPYTESEFLTKVSAYPAIKVATIIV